MTGAADPARVADPAMVLATDADGRIVAVGAAWLDQLGYGRSDVVGRRFDDLVAQASRVGLDAWLGRLAAPDRSAGAVACVVHRRDGAPVELLVTTVLDLDDSSAPARRVMVMEPSGARMGVEEALRFSRGVLERTGAVAGIGGWELDLRTGMVTWSDHTCCLHDREVGHRPTLAEGIAYYAPEAQPAIAAALERAIATGEGWDLELRVISARGRSFWSRVTGRVERVGDVSVRVVGEFQDVTRRRLLEDQLDETRRLLEVTLSSIGDGVITTDPAARVTWMNPVARRMTGWSREAAATHEVDRVVVVMDRTTRVAVANPIVACLDEGRVVALAGNAVLAGRDGPEYGITGSAAPIRGPDGRVHGAVLVFHDVTEQRRLTDAMEHHATHDVLTGAVNRAAFEVALEMLLTDSRACGRTGALLHVDLDRFRMVNDSCGHAVGDALLREVAALLKAAVRERDLVARIGGDTFAILLRDCPVGVAHDIAQGIRGQAAGRRFVHDGQRFRIEMSIGVVEIDANCPDLLSVLQAADGACHVAKENGRNRVQIWSRLDAWTASRQRETRWAARLEQALDDDRFELFIQKIHAIRGGCADGGRGIIGEVLLRLREPDGSIVLPGAFIHAAERFHMVSRLDRRVVETVLALLATDVDADRIEMISINLSGQSIGDAAFRQEICRLVGMTDFPCKKLCFEITETVAIQSLVNARAFIDDVRALGVRVALDDFGAGASSFNYLRSLPIDFIKIDGQFIDNLLTDQIDRAAVKCFKDVAVALGVMTIAEFVERPEQLAALIDLEIDMAQGYLIHRPEPFRDVF